MIFLRQLEIKIDFLIHYLVLWRSILETPPVKVLECKTTGKRPRGQDTRQKIDRRNYWIGTLDIRLSVPYAQMAIGMMMTPETGFTFLSFACGNHKRFD